MGLGRRTTHPRNNAHLAVEGQPWGRTVVLRRARRMRQRLDFSRIRGCHNEPPGEPMKSEDVALLQQTEHPMLPLPDAAERSRQDFVRSFKAVLQSDLEPGLETTYKGRIATDWAKQHGAPPANRHEIRKAMVVNPYFQTFASLTRVSQELLWDTVIDSVERQLPELMEKAARCPRIPSALGPMWPRAQASRCTRASPPEARTGRRSSAWHGISADHPSRPKGSR